MSSGMSERSCGRIALYVVARLICQPTMNLSKRNYARLRVASLLYDTSQAGLLVSCMTLGSPDLSFRSPPVHVGAQTYFTTVWTLRTPRGPPQHDLADAPENQQRQLREVRDETTAPRLAGRF